MRNFSSFLALARTPCLVAVVMFGGIYCVAVSGREQQDTAPQKPDTRLVPYSADPRHLWNRLHQALFTRVSADGRQHIHTFEPLLFRGSSLFLLEGEPHRKAVGLLDELLGANPELPPESPLKRLFLQHDLWAAFDYTAWYPDNWVHHTRHEPAAVALRSRLAKAIGRLALNEQELAALPDNYAMAIQSKAYPPAHSPEHPEQPFLPADLFDPAGPWVRFHETTANPMAEQHFDGACGRSAHVIFIRLPDGRAATEEYLAELKAGNFKQFPPGTAVAMVRRALTIDTNAKMRVTPVTELVQIRVYRQIPALPDPSERVLFASRPGEQDVYEFVLDRPQFFAGQHGLRAVGPDEPEETFVRRDSDPFERKPRPRTESDEAPPAVTVSRQLQTCIGCHAGPGIFSVISMQRAFKRSDRELFRTYDWNVELNYTVHAKTKRYDWGLLQGKLEKP